MTTVDTRVRATTPAEIASALRLVADQLDAMSDRDVASPSHPHVTVAIQPRDAAEVDRYALALFGAPAETIQMSSGSFHHTTAFTGRHRHASGLTVDVYTSVEDPMLATAKAERDALLAEVAELRESRGARTAEVGAS